MPLMPFVSHGGVVAKKLGASAVQNVNQRLGRHQPLVLVLGSIAVTYALLRFHWFWMKSERSLWARFKIYVFQYARRVPWLRRQIEDSLQSQSRKILDMIHASDTKREYIKTIPDVGLTNHEILEKTATYVDMNTKFDISTGHVSGTVYTDLNEELLEMLATVFKRFAYSNPLHPTIFPGARKMEAEIIRMVVDLFNGGPEACGTMSSGGTESILLACLAHRNRALANGVENPVIVAPVTAHAAFEKAADILGIRIRHVKMDNDGRVNLTAMRRAITSDVCMLVGSAPCFSTGTFDNIPEISKLGVRYNIPVHVDACLGGFLIPFVVDEPDIDIPHFDFRLPGVCSISCDTHKYGYSPKGSSTILYRSHEYLHHQYFTITGWPGGIYATPAIAGSRAGLNIALTWATMLHFGYKKYKERALEIVKMTRKLADKIRAIPDLHIVGTPDLSIVAFGSTEFNIHAVADELAAKHWSLNSIQNPSGVHFCLTYNQVNQHHIDAFLADLRVAIQTVRELPDRGGKSETAQIYGMAGSVPDALLDEVATVYLDTCFMLPATS